MHEMRHARWEKRKGIEMFQRVLDRGYCDRIVDSEFKDHPQSQWPYALYREAVRKKIVELKEEIRRRNDWQGKPKEEIWSQVVARTSTTSKEILHYRCKMPFHIFSQRCT
jgi:N-acyl-D-aspartate/D-glutamate deacylase